MTTPLESGYLPALYDVLEFLAQIKDQDEDALWSRLCEKLAVALDCEAATYYCYLASKRQLLPRYMMGRASSDIQGTAVDIRTGLCGWVAMHREPLLIEDAHKDERFLIEVDRLTGFRTKTVLAVPLAERHELTGVLQLINTRAGLFTLEDLRFVQTVCRQASIALRLAKVEGMVDKVASRNASILESLGGGFLAVDTHGKIILCNPAAKRILGLPSDLPLTTPVEQALMHLPRLADVLLDALATRKVVKRQELQWSLRGEERILGYGTILIQDPQGQITGAGVTFQDITGLKRA